MDGLVMDYAKLRNTVYTIVSAEDYRVISGMEMFFFFGSSP
jgi:hypothetical protein